jgi:5-(carboxyamino)imidazole ribonucleotide synthase
MKIGILGGGQLAMMLSESLARLGATPVVYDPDPQAPAKNRLRHSITASFEDKESLKHFFGSCERITYELESLPLEVLKQNSSKVSFFPDLNILEIAQDRAKEKSFFVQNQLPCVKHLVVGPQESLSQAVTAFGLPAIAKTTRGGYDGKGQYFLRTAEDALEAQKTIPQATWILEEVVEIVAEASCIVARSDNEETVFPVVENVHKEHILDRSLVPCRLPQEINEQIKSLSLKAARALKLKGLLTIEFFVTRSHPRNQSSGDYQLLLNELAPRPHNSGHLFNRASNLSQFDALARILTDTPLGTPTLLPGAYCMGNLLGNVWLKQGRAQGQLDLTAWKDHPEVVELYLYGKEKAEAKRKMGHFIVFDSQADRAFHMAESFRRDLLKDPTA